MMAAHLGVSRSGFYAWRDKQIAKAADRDTKAQDQRRFDALVRRVWLDSGKTYGYPRIRAVLASKHGVFADRKTVAKSMARQGIAGISPRTFTPKTTIPGPSNKRVKDLVKRRFVPEQVNQVWYSDITYLRTGEGWLYLCSIIDGASRRVVGWAMDSTMTTDLVETALRRAWTLRGGRVLPGLVLHSDRGCQYTSARLHQVCSELGITQSMGRSGICFDNSLAESFWSTLKHEFYKRSYYPSRAKAAQEVSTWIETTYNRARIHSGLGYQTPVEYELARTLQERKAA